MKMSFNRSECKCLSNCNEMKFTSSVDKYPLHYRTECEENRSSLQVCYGGVNGSQYNAHDLNVLIAEKIRYIISILGCH